MNKLKMIKLVCALLWALAAICFFLCAIMQLESGHYGNAILYLICVVLDGVNSYMSFYW
jgi:hypothetical protein